MEKYQLFNILLGTYVIGGSIYFLKYKKKTLQIIQDLKKHNQTLKSKIDNSLVSQRQIIINDLKKPLMMKRRSLLII